MRSFSSTRKRKIERPPSSERSTRDGGDISANLDASGNTAASAVQTMAEASKRSPRVQSQIQLARSLNEGPRAATQRRTAEVLLARNGSAPVMAADDRRGLASETTQRHCLRGEEETAQAKCMGAAGIKPALEEDEDQAETSLEADEMVQGKFARAQSEEGTDDEEYPMQAKPDQVQRLNGSSAEPMQPAASSEHRNHAGLPDDLKAGIENLSGMSMDDVRIHYNSSKPAQLNALAYTQGRDIHVAPGQQEHLAHEAWHVAQQKQGRVKPTIQLRGVGINDDRGLEREADVMGKKAASTHRDSESVPAASHRHQGSSLTPAGEASPIQPVWGILGGGLAGLGLGGYFGASVGSSVGGAIGGVVGSMFGPAGTVVGETLLSGLGGLVGGVAGGLAGGITAGLTGNAIESARSKPPSTATNKVGKSIGDIVYTRAEALAEKDKKEGRDDFIGYLEPGLKKVIEENLDSLKMKTDVIDAINEYYKDRIAQPGQYRADTAYNEELSNALFDNPFIKMVLKGGLHKKEGIGKGKEKDEENEFLDEPGTLVVPNRSPQRVEEARIMFNKLVTRKLPAITRIKRKLGPESAIGHEGDLHLGWGSPRGAVLHEFGHHLEQNSSPEDIATVHNFLRARSKSNNLRRVGYEGLINKSLPETGYDIEMPNINAGNYRSLWGLTANSLLYLAGSETGEKGVDRFVIGHANNPEASYSSQVYPKGLDTEYISTTIQFFAEPETAIELIHKDPLRVSLFLSLAQPRQYGEVRKAFGQASNVDLDKLIHRL